MRNDRTLCGGGDDGTCTRANPRPSGLMFGNGCVGTEADPGRAGDAGGVAGRAGERMGGADAVGALFFA